MYHRYHGWSRRYAFAHAYHQPSYESRKHSSYRSHGGFGVRRPLRYLGYHLDLDDEQMRRVAAILDRLKNEREQAKLDESRTVSELAALVVKEGVSIDDLKAALAPRVASAERLQLVVARAVQEITEVLELEQREEFAYLLSNRSIVL